MSNLTEWAKAELDRITHDGDEIQTAVNNDILQVVEVFAGQGHSEFSASYVLRIINRLLNWKPIAPLTGEDDEWGPVDEWGNGEKVQQNKRCPAVFRHNHDNSTAYYLDGKAFSDDGGKSWYTSSDSLVPVVFPFTVPDEPQRIILSKEEQESMEDTVDTSQEVEIKRVED